MKRELSRFEEQEKGGMRESSKRGKIVGESEEGSMVLLVVE